MSHGVWWIIIACPLISSVQSLDVSIFTTTYKSVSVKCTGLSQHITLLNKSLSILEEFQMAQLSQQNSDISKLPQCSMWTSRNRIELTGVGEISDKTLKNAAHLISAFTFDLPIPFPETNYLKIYSTIFENPSYVSAAVNWCRALNTKYSIKCYYIDVIRNPSVLATAMRPVPWMEVRVGTMKLPAIIPDKYPNLWEFRKQQGLVSPEEMKEEQEEVELRMDQCVDMNCDVSLMRDELMYSQEYWKQEIKPHLPVKVEYLGNTGIAEAPNEVLQIISGEINELKFAEIVFVIYTLEPKECGSCQNALPELKQLKEQTRKDRSKLYFINCDKNPDFCRSQGITGFPTFLTYKIPLISNNPTCEDSVYTLTTLNYHGTMQAASLIEWYEDVRDMGVHYTQPHTFHHGCNVHISITATKDSVDRLPVECLVGVCKKLAFSECFILQDSTEDVYVSSIELQRRDGVVSVIYEDNLSLDISFTRSQELHRYHGNHHYNHPSCASSPTECIRALHTFISQHSRTPLTELSPIVFHSPSSYKPLFGNLPVLVALVEHQATNQPTSGFMEILHEVSVKFYNQIATSYVDVDMYPHWVHGMTPVAERDLTESSWIYQYPRVLVFQLEDHKHSAFCRVVGKELGREELERFVEKFLEGMKMERCHGI